MSEKMKVSEFISKLNLALNSKTLYVMGCFGAPMIAKNKKRYSTNYAYNATDARKKKILSASDDTFGFDCVNLIKGILWGWNADKVAIYGGATYCSNGVPDIGTESIIKQCTEVSTDFNNLVDGELLYKKGHVGVVLDAELGLAVECTPAWKDGVQITAIARDTRSPEANMYHTRAWTSHGKLPWIDYDEKPVEEFIYRVQVGVYRKEANAMAKLKELQDAGFKNAIIRKELNNES